MKQSSQAEVGMARRRNTDHYEELSPTMVIPDHFSSNKKSKIVIIYDESIGIKEDNVTFIFPGEVSGGALKKVVPQRIDSRTFVIETPTYSVLRHGSIFVCPQLRLTSGEVVEMADFKISLKHPVRNVMELCLSLSTQQAVLPVLLTLLIHANQDKHDQQNHFLQDPHFDQIMATLVGSMEPRTRHVRDIILPNKKWKRLLLTEFARDFKMQEMEKQAYMLSKRAKDKKKAVVDKRRRESAVVSEDDDSASLFRSHYFSSSTPDIHRLNQSSAFANFDRSSTHSMKKKGKTLPKIPKIVTSRGSALHSGQLIERAQSEEAMLETSVYDAVKFDVDDEEDDFDLPASPPNRPPPQIPKIRTIPKMNQQTTSSKEDGDGLSLDSYEEMNEVPPLGESLRPWDMFGPPTEEPPPFPPQRDSSIQKDPASRGKMPLPSPPQSSVPHYTVSTKQRKKPDENRPLPPEPKCPPPPSKAPFPAPKTKGVKKLASKSFRRRREDVYVAESESDCEDFTDTMISDVESSKRKKKLSYTNVNVNDGAIDEVTGEHLYDSAEMVTAKKKAKKKGASHQIEDNVEPLHPGRPSIKYQNVNKEPCYDENPSLPPPPPSHPPPSEPPSLPPRHEQLEVSHNQEEQPPPKKLPKVLKPLKPKVLPATPPKLPSQKPNASAVKSNSKKIAPVPPAKPDAVKQMSELNAVLSNRNTRGGGAGGVPGAPPVAQKKPHRKRGDPQLPRPPGGMTDFI